MEEYCRLLGTSTDQNNEHTSKFQKLMFKGMNSLIKTAFQGASKVRAPAPVPDQDPATTLMSASSNSRSRDRYCCSR